MRIRLADISISTRVALACLVPLAGLAIFALVEVADAWVKARAARDVLAATEVAEAAGLAIHELQKERGMSSGFVASKGASFAGELPGQRKESDRRVEALRHAVANSGQAVRSGTLGSRLATAADDLKRIDDVRQKVSGLSIAAGEAAAVYTGVIGSLLAAGEAIGELSQDAAIVRMVPIYTAVVRGKEYAGQERATGARGFAGARFTAADLRAFISLGAAQEGQFDLVRRGGSPAQHEGVKAALSGAAAAEVARMREAALSSTLTGSPGGVTSAAWFAASTARIDDLKKVEDRFAAELKTVAEGVAADATRTLMLVLGAAMGLFSFAAATAFLSARSITRPLGNLVGTTLTLAGGNTAVDIQGSDRRDEIGEMTRAVVVFRDNAVERMRLEEAARAEQAAREARQRNVEAMIDRFRSSVAEKLEAVGDNAAQMDGTAKALSGIANEASSQAASAGAASHQASANVQNVAGAAEELSGSIQEIGTQVESASGVVQRATEMAEASNSEFAGLAGAAQRIGDVVGLIQAIAAQTNLLALNATIEAARAGEAGRGFAVVAAEVKTLATQTAKATEEIAQQVAAIQTSTGRAVESMDAITSTMKDVNGYTSAIAAAIEEQGAATREISQNVQMAARGTEELSHNVGEVTGAIRSTSGAAENVLAASGKLAAHASDLKSEVDRFLSDVAAA
jgi:methyl-accepting chemotaxis protein